ALQLLVADLAVLAAEALAAPADQLVVAQQEERRPVAEAVDALDDAADQQQLVGGAGDLLHELVQGGDVGGAVGVLVAAGELLGQAEAGQLVHVLELLDVAEHAALEGVDAVQQQLHLLVDHLLDENADLFVFHATSIK